MDLDKVTAVIRPRSDWEAVDLGVALVRRDYPRIFLASALSFLPLILLIGGLLWKHPWWALVAILWLRPLHDRVVLALIGPALFGEKVGVWRLLKGLPKLWWRQLFQALTIRRFSSLRTFLLPVVQLEQLRGADYRARRDVLTRLSSGKSEAALITSLLLQVAFALGLLFLFVGLNPLGYGSRFALVSIVAESFQSLAGQWKIVSAFLVSAFLWGPFAVGAGFGSYLNARVRLEGWDLEIAYRRLGARLTALKTKSPAQSVVSVATGLIVLGTTLCLGPISMAQGLEFEEGGGAADQRSRENIEAVMADEAFEVETYTIVQRYSRGGGGFEGFAWLGQIIASIAQIAVYLAIGLAIGWAVYLIAKYLQTFKPKPKRGQRKPAGKMTKARKVMGMDIGAEDIPDQFHEAAWRLWQAGEQRASLGLLYRGALSALVEKERVPIRESDTENDCLRRAAGIQPPTKVEWFANLTQVWIAMAYGKRLPTDSVVEELCRNCPFASGATASSGNSPSTPTRSASA